MSDTYAGRTSPRVNDSDPTQVWERYEVRIRKNGEEYWLIDTTWKDDTIAYPGTPEGKQRALAECQRLNEANRK